MELRLFDKTTSPREHYALAWGIPGVANIDAVDWKLHLERARNYIVDKRTMRPLATLPMHVSNYKEGGNDFPGRSHSSMQTIWNPTEQTLLIVHDGKWWYDAIYFCEQFRGGFRVIEIGDSIEAFVRQKVQNRHPREFSQDHRNDDRDPFVNLKENRGRVFYPGKLILKVVCDSVERTKSEDYRLHTEGTVELCVTSSWQRLTATPTRFTPTQRKP